MEGLYPSNVAGKIAGGTHTHADTQASLIPRPLPSIARIDQVGGGGGGGEGGRGGGGGGGGACTSPPRVHKNGWLEEERVTP